MRATTAVSVTVLVLVLASLPQAQGTAPATPLTLITRDGRRPVATIVRNGQEFIGLDDVATLFQVAVREDALAGGVTITYKGRTIVASTEEPMASVGGRVVALPTPVARVGRRLLVPIDFLPRVLGPIYDSPIELRRPARLLVVGAVRISRVVARLDAAGPPTRATIEVSPASTVSVSTEPTRVLLRLDTDAVDIGVAATTGGLIDQIRAADPPNVVAVSLSARSGVPRVSTTTLPDMIRITIEVPLAPQSQEITALPPPVPAPPSATPPAEGPLPSLTAEAPGLRTIVIDPGHGGDDAGVHGAKGTLEKQVALEIARRLGMLIETRLGVRVVMTHDDDRMMTLDERDAVANNSKADLFLSIHANGSLSPKVAGAEIYSLRLDREGEDARRTVAATELVLPVAGGGMRPIDFIRWDLAQAPHVDASAAFASMLEEELRKHVPMGARPRQQEPMRVLAGANMPAALVEIAYLTNPGQEQAAQSDDFQAGAAQALYDAVTRFKGYLESAPDR